MSRVNQVGTEHFYLDSCIHEFPPMLKLNEFQNALVDWVIQGLLTVALIIHFSIHPISHSQIPTRVFRFTEPSNEYDELPIVGIRLQ